MEYKYEGVIAKVVDTSEMAFDASQGPKGRAFRLSHPDIYQRSNLSLFGELYGPKHFDDLSIPERYGRLQMLANNRVHDSWREIIEIGKEALMLGHGQMSWLYRESDGFLILYFAIPEGDHNPRLDWLFQHEPIRRIFAQEIRTNARIMFQTGPLDNPRDNGWRGYN